MKPSIILVAVTVMLSGCAANSGVVEVGPGAYLVSRQASTGFSGAGTLKADAINEAGAYCAKQGKKINVTHAEEAQPPYILGNYPKAEVQFMCQ
jgi:uncharacterized lipoprotein YajG